MRRGDIIKKLLLFRLIRKLPLYFKLLPLGPAALLIGSLFASIRALGRVRRLERRMATTAS